jgi:pyruvate,orthophosphate dikinase
MDGFPVTIRTLDPPLHEFLPKDEAAIARLAQRMGITVEQVTQTINRLHEENPMLGFRGCRLGITYPEITEMQARAVFEAACLVKQEGIKVLPEVMIPLVGDVTELRLQRQLVVSVAEEVFVKAGVRVDYLVGTMIEVPRAALTADEVARSADFFSFGTNDLTQMTFGFSRDDVGAFVPEYQATGILPADPFNILDQVGVGELVKIGIERGRATKPNLKVGICGEHGGEPSSVAFCHRVGMDYVSCSPFRVPIANLAAAQAAIRDREKAGSKGKKAVKKAAKAGK